MKKNESAHLQSQKNINNKKNVKCIDFVEFSLINNIDFQLEKFGFVLVPDNIYSIIIYYSFIK